MKKIIRKLVSIELTWKIIHFFYRVFYRFKFEKDLIPIEIKNKEMAQREAVMKKKYSNLTVADGPFKGMIYPDFIAYGSAMYPKLLGCYESELNPSLESLLKTDYHSLVDIGCAEGYYAVGVAMRQPNAMVYAYDIDVKAMEACEKMAKLNKAEKNMRFGTFCSPETLIGMDFEKKSLIFSDCEGYEMDLFTPDVVKNLKNCDLIIELHDLYTEKISPTIFDAFSASHHIKLVYSENTFIKMRTLNLIGDLTDDQILNFFVERNGIMSWAIITPK
jgi:hypothetical protein